MCAWRDVSTLASALVTTKVCVNGVVCELFPSSVWIERCASTSRNV